MAPGGAPNYGISCVGITAVRNSERLLAAGPFVALRHNACTSAPFMNAARRWMFVLVAVLPAGFIENSAAADNDGLAAWRKVYSVVTSPRCINCHTATTYPQQGD